MLEVEELRDQDRSASLPTIAVDEIKELKLLRDRREELLDYMEVVLQPCKQSHLQIRE